MDKKIKSDYREKLYSSYVSTHIGGDIQSSIQARSSYIKRIIKRFFPGKRDSCILEIGCGHGVLLYFAREMGYSRLKGVDTSVEQVREAENLGLSGIVVQDEIVNVLRNYQDNSLDMVVALDVIEHLTKDELLVILYEVNRVLKKQGSILLHMPNATSPFFGRIRYGDFTHELAFTQTSISQLLKVAGFRNINSYEDMIVIHSIKSLIRWVLWKVIRNILTIAMAAESGTTHEIFTQNMFSTAEKR